MHVIAGCVCPVIPSEKPPPKLLPILHGFTTQQPMWLCNFAIFNMSFTKQPPPYFVFVFLISALCSRRSDCSDWLSELLRKFVVAEGGDDADAPTSLFTFRSDANA